MEPKKKTKAISSLYEFDGKSGTIALRNRKCPRCGAVMAGHKAPTERWTCGSCSYTDYVKGR